MFSFLNFEGSGRTRMQISLLGFGLGPKEAQGGPRGAQGALGPRLWTGPKPRALGPGPWCVVPSPWSLVPSVALLSLG